MSVKKVALAISGGVDSAVSGLLLKSKGFNVQAVFMKNWDLADERGFCSANEDYADADFVCRKLDIPLIEMNFVKDYWHSVFTNFLQDYQKGLTPNPDILCNKHIKFDIFFRNALEKLGVDAIATGHYARTSFGPYLEEASDKKPLRLLQAADKFKDQTFFLSQVDQKALRKTMFPLGNMLKRDVKQMAAEAGLERVLFKKESTGICFVGKRDFKQFISDYLNKSPGNFVDIDTGAIVGAHNGIHNYTVGQRCKLKGQTCPYFVVRKCTEKDEILVANKTNHPSLFSDLVYTEKPHWICGRPIELINFGLLNCYFRFQHTKPLVKCRMLEANPSSERLVISLSDPLRAVTPGQFAVFYNNDECLGSARIIAPGPSIKYCSTSKYINFNNNIMEEDNNETESRATLC